MDGNFNGSFRHARARGFFRDRMAVQLYSAHQCTFGEWQFGKKLLDIALGACGFGFIGTEQIARIVAGSARP